MQSGHGPIRSAPRAQRLCAVRATLLGAVLVAVLVFTGSGLAQLPAQLPPLPEHHLEAPLLTRTNAAREEAGAAPVAHSPALAQAARHHAEEMARLGYLSHVSPTPGRGRPEERVRLVGGTVAVLGENLAEVSARGTDVAERVVTGWLASPGHRSNLLRDDWTHVGFGVAESASGRAYVAQVFAADTHPLRAVSVSRSPERTLALRFEVFVSTAGSIAMSTSDAGVTPLPAAAQTTHTLVVDGLPADAATHVRLGWSPDGSNSFIAQQSGWFDPTSGSWSEDWSDPARHAEVSAYSVAGPVQAVTLQLAFEREPSGVILLVDGAQLAPGGGGASLEVRLPGSEGVRDIVVGLPEADGRVRVVHAFEVEVREGAVRVR